jgi:hypothetical protein
VGRAEVEGLDHVKESLNEEGDSWRERLSEGELHDGEGEGGSEVEKEAQWEEEKKRAK